MSEHTLRLFEDHLAARSEISLPSPGGCRVVYVVEGNVEIATDDQIRKYMENSAWFGTGACVPRAGGQGARLWRWELVRTSAAVEEAGGRVHSSLKESHEVHLEPGEEYLMRCDRVDFPLGGIAYTHTHSGPGIRCLLRGEIRVQVQHRDVLAGAGESWFERGPDPVLAQASETELTSFVRSMILPRSFKGRSSIQYTRPEDADKPKLQKYTCFVDEFVEI